MAQKSTSKFRLGAVLTKRGRVINAGFNRMNKTHPKQQKFHNGEGILGIHAEVDCCLGIPTSDLLGAEIYVARILRNGSPALARPCATCMRFLKSVGIERVTFTTDSGIKEIEL